MRVLLKLSGESLGGPEGRGIDSRSLVDYAHEIAEAAKAGHQIAVVNGGGNIFRGLQGVGKGFDRVNGDRMGMLATVINSLGLACALRSEGLRAEVFTATPMEPIARYYRKEDAVKLMEEGGVALISGGTGNPFFTTDRPREGPDRRQIRRAHFHQGPRRPSESHGRHGLRALRTGPRTHNSVQCGAERQSRQTPRRREDRHHSPRLKKPL